MKIQCNACEAAEAAVLCCADEAALCLACDEKVHAANKLAGKHQRVSLISSGSSSSSSPSSSVPNCDICQEATGFFFCLEDRALLCRKCDVAIHSANAYVHGHQRFLLTGVRVGLEPSEPVTAAPKEQSSSEIKTVEPSIHKKITLGSSYSENNEVVFNELEKHAGVAVNKMAFPTAGTPGAFNNWPLDDFFGLTDFNQNFGFTEHGSSKADGGKFGSSEGSYCSTDEQLDADCLGQVPEFQWTVPEISSPPTSSGLHWQKNLHFPAHENTAFVPDIYPFGNATSKQGRILPSKRRRF